MVKELKKLEWSMSDGGEETGREGGRREGEIDGVEGKNMRAMFVRV